MGLRWLFLAALGPALLAFGLTARGLVGRIDRDGRAGPRRRWSPTANDQAPGPGVRRAARRGDGDGHADLGPGMSIAQGVDDLKARDMVLCRFPEVAMVVGKLGRAETPTDPAPLDMIETMVELHPREAWPARAIDPRTPAARCSRPSSPRWPATA